MLQRREETVSRVPTAPVTRGHCKTLKNAMARGMGELECHMDD